MTKLEYKEMVAAFRAQQRKIQDKIDDLKNRFLAECPLKVGDKVIIKDVSENMKFRQPDKVCFIERIVASDTDWVMKFVKAKKDGTPSMISEHIYNPYITIEKLES